MPGAFNLTTPRDLLKKLARELCRLRAAPDDVDHAFNFFVTAESILDWLHPGDAGKLIRNAARNAEPLLQLVSHIASGAKHFDKLHQRHKSVRGFLAGIWPVGFWATDFWSKGFWDEAIGFALDGSAEAALGSRISAVDVATKVLEYWSVPGRVP